MLNDKLRPQTNEVTEKIGEKIPINPNIMTIIGLLISIFAGVLYASDNLIAGTIFIILGGFCDMLDGAIARSQDNKSKFGGFLDSVCDRFADAAILIGLIYSGYVPAILGALAIHSSITVSYVRSRAETEGIPCTVGIAERAERLIIIIIGVLLGVLVGRTHTIIFIAIVLLTALSYITVIQRVYHVWNVLENRGRLL